MSYQGQATVLSPPSWGPAVELANRQWKKKILPIGDVQYEGRTLHFTRDYLRTLCNSWRDRAYDQVPFQLATGKNEHTNDPERTRGQITDLQLSDDGLYAVLSPTDRGEQVLAENPYLGVSARIVENYQRSDGKFYPAAIQHVLGTLDPRIPSLGQWEPISLSNSGGLIIDLSGASWAGEPGPPLPADGDYELSDQELAELLEAMEEADAMPAGDYRELPPQFAQLEDFDRQFSASYAAGQALELARQQADLEDSMRKPGRIGHETDYDRLERLTSRISQGIQDTSRVADFSNQDRSIELTVASGYGPSTDALGFTFVDAFGRDATRYPFLQSQSDLSTDWMAQEGGPPRSTFEASLSNFAATHDLGGTPASYGGDPGDPDSTGHAFPQRVTELASRLNESWGLHSGTGHLSPAPSADDLFDASPSYAGDAYSALAAEAGRSDLAGPQPRRASHLDVSGYRARMGI